MSEGDGDALLAVPVERELFAADDKVPPTRDRGGVDEECHSSVTSILHCEPEVKIFTLNNFVALELSLYIEEEINFSTDDNRNIQRLVILYLPVFILGPETEGEDISVRTFTCGNFNRHQR